VLVPDVTVDPRYLLVNPETRSELAVPMLHKGKILGVLDLESAQLNAFTQDHVQTLSILAANLAVRWRMQGCTSRSHEMKRGSSAICRLRNGFKGL